jgi:hypothetical protein
LIIRIPIVQEMDMVANTPGKMPEASKRREKKRMHKSHWKVAALAHVQSSRNG